MIKKKVSIIIRTKNEERWIALCLKKIYLQTYKNFEIILVDNFSEDKTLIKANKFKLKKIIKIKSYLPGKALNLGIKHSNGEYLVFISAHCIPKNNSWLATLVKSISENDLFAGVYGRQEPMNFSNDSDTRDLLLVFGLDRKVQENDTFFHNANSIIRKKLWNKFKFDNRTKNIEDRLWAKKILNFGYKILYEPNASVYHYHGIHQNNNFQRLNNVVRIIKNESNEAKGKINPLDLKIVAIIPKKGNLLKINNKYLLEYSFKNLKESKYIDEIFLSTDSKINQKIAIKNNIKCPFLRPSSLSKGFVNIDKVQSYTLQQIEKNGYLPDLIVHVEETFPFRPFGLIDKMIDKLLSEGLDTVIAGKIENGWLWNESQKGLFTRIDSGDVPRKYKESTLLGLKGLCTVTYPTFVRNGTLIGKNIGIFQVDSQISCIEIRDENTITLANKIIKNKIF